MLCGTVSNALHKSREMMSVALPLSTDDVNPSEKATKFVRHDLPLVKPCWLSPITSLFSMCLSIVSRRVCSMILPGTEGFVPWYSTKQIPQEAKVCSPEVQGSELAECPPRCPEDPELHHFMVTAAKAALELDIPYQALLIGENKVQHGTSPRGLLYHLEEKFVINTFQEPPGLLALCCVLPPADVRVVEVPHKDQGL
ncbi:highly reducing polyketide synthase PKS6 [Grus japonensis]|uniref:Highly reducing polyketide synthase PKS6 n=1 Tax=Grus japonensis TaxID=30415 RepID=A0ABC9YKD7_GRUJA